MYIVSKHEYTVRMESARGKFVPPKTRVSLSECDALDRSPLGKYLDTAFFRKSNILCEEW